MDCRSAPRRPVAAEWRLSIYSCLPRVAVALAILATPLAAQPAEQPAPLADSSLPENTEAGPSIVEAMRHDAALADACFVDLAAGWAVGDRGVIWHTANGGESWQRQTSGVSASLNSVCFLDASRGWIGGGESRPYGTASRGVLLRTSDGGATWTHMPQPLLPRLTRVEFFDPNRGIAVGSSTPADPSGVFFTQDGGETWHSLPTDRTGAWLAGDFLDSQTGAVAGAGGDFATLARRQVVRSAFNASTLRSLHALRLVAPTTGWLVGDGGVVMTSRDLGHSWQTPPAELPESAEQFDFRALAVHGQHVWVAGWPGTRIFHSPNGGQSWQSATTGQWAPLHSLTFVDATHGWAVGDFGNILATRDGGQSWHVQRSGGERAALLAVFADARNVPLELLADSGAAGGYITAVDLVHKTAAGPADPTPAPDARHRDAMLLAGAAAANTAWRFPLPPEDLALAAPDVLAALNRANDGRAVEQLERHLVRRLRMWRPEVVVTHHGDLEKCQPAAALLAALMPRAVEAAADPTRHVDLAADAGLPPWQVKRVFGLLPPDSRGNASITTGEFSPLVGTTLADFVSPARHLLAATHAAPPDVYELELLASYGTNASDRRGLFSGIALAHGSDARRPAAQLPVNDLESLRRMAARRRHLEELMERTEGNVAWAGQVNQLTKDLKPNDGAELLLQLADGYRAAGRPDLAADTYYRLARQYPDHVLVDRALVWLAQFYASSEAGHHVGGRRPTDVRQAAFEESASLPPAATSSPEDRLRRAVQLVEYFRTTRPALYAEPAVRFAEIAAQRQLGFANPAKRYYLALAQLPQNDPWRQCGETEEWLASPAELPPPKRFGACRPARQRPHLDGALDDACWQHTDRLRLRDSDETQTASGAEARLAYDDEFLYLAIRCPKWPSLPYTVDGNPRPRDADLSQHDRVQIRLDIDRDFTTAYELTVDSRGWTHDACWGDAHWNPEWFVAAGNDDTTWTAEAAIPLAELVATPPAARHVWALAVRRTIPRRGYETWENGDAPTAAQFGFLIFE